MSKTKEWHVDIRIDEEDSHTRARAHLAGRSDALDAEGDARRNPSDTNIPAIGDELAVARALSELAHRLLQAAAADIETSTHQPVHRLNA